MCKGLLRSEKDYESEVRVSGSKHDVANVDRYLSRYPTKTKLDFFNAIDTWLSSVILLATSSQAKSAYSTSTPSVLSLPPPIFQLLLGEPTVLQRVEITELLLLALEESKVPSGTLKTAAASSLGITTGLFYLLQSPSDPIRLWATAQLPACSRRPLSLAEWVGNGLEAELHAMAMSSAGGYEEGADMRWEAIRLLLESGVLSQEALELGLLEGERKGWKSSEERGVMSVLAGLLSGQSDREYTMQPGGRNALDGGQRRCADCRSIH
jgi:hypothetical protein